MAKLADLMKELRDVKASVEKVENIVEKRLVGEDTPLKDEIAITKEYELLKDKGALKLVSLEEALKSVGVHRPSRKAGR